MASWGEISVGNLRPTSGRPTKSSLIGLISASLGLDRFDEASQKTLYMDYDYVVISSGTESEMKDYATVQTSKIETDEKYTALPPRPLELSRKNVETMLVDRRYLCNGYYSVIVIPNNDAKYSLEEIADALRRPKYTPYLGRKSCPLSFPMMPSIEAYDDLMALIENKSFEPFMHDEFQESRYLSKNKQSMNIVSTYQIDSNKPSIRHVRHDDMPNRSNWLFFDRIEYEYRSDGE